MFSRLLPFDVDGRASLLMGGVGILILAYLVRFQAVGYGAVLSGIRRLPDNMMGASRVLGNGFTSSLRRVILPLLSGSMVAGGLLVFVDVMKELPMTLLLRPFNGGDVHISTCGLSSPYHCTHLNCVARGTRRSKMVAAA